MAKLSEKQIKYLRMMAESATGVKVPGSNRVGSPFRSFKSLEKKGLAKQTDVYPIAYEITDAGRAAIMADASAAAQPATVNAEAWTPAVGDSVRVKVTGRIVVVTAIEAAFYPHPYLIEYDGQKMGHCSEDELEPAPTASADAVTEADETVTFAEYQDRRREIYELTHERDYLQREYDAISQAFDGYMKANAEREDREAALTRDLEAARAAAAALRDGANGVLIIAALGIRYMDEETSRASRHLLEVFIREHKLERPTELLDAAPDNGQRVSAWTPAHGTSVRIRLDAKMPQDSLTVEFQRERTIGYVLALGGCEEDEYVVAFGDVTDEDNHYCFTTEELEPVKQSAQS